MKGLESVFITTCKREIWCCSERRCSAPSEKRDGRAKTLPGLKNHQKKVTFSISIPSSNESKVKVQSE